MDPVYAHRVLDHSLYAERALDGLVQDSRHYQSGRLRSSRNTCHYHPGVGMGNHPPGSLGDVGNDGDTRNLDDLVLPAHNSLGSLLLNQHNINIDLY